MKKDTYQRELEREKEAIYEAARKYNRAQARLNRAAVAWAMANRNEEFAENYNPKGLYGVEVMLARAVRAFQKAGKR